MSISKEQINQAAELLDEATKEQVLEILATMKPEPQPVNKSLIGFKDLFRNCIPTGE